VPFFFKSWGEWRSAHGYGIRGAFLKHFQHLDGTLMIRTGKKIADHRIDGKEWREFPK
jgi:hypothetical protein